MLYNTMLYNRCYITWCYITYPDCYITWCYITYVYYITKCYITCYKLVLYNRLHSYITPCYIAYVCYITGCYILCYDMLLHNRLHNMVRINIVIRNAPFIHLSSSAGTRSSRRRFNVSAALRRASLVRSLRLFSASATVTWRGWPLPYRHIQRLSSYSLLPLPLPALVSATAPWRSPNRWGRVGVLFPPTKHGISGTRPSTLPTLHR
jgi:hypothetical protein